LRIVRNPDATYPRQRQDLLRRAPGDRRPSVGGRPPSSQPGVLFYIMVDSVKDTVAAVMAHGGEIVQAIGADAPEITARFRDPGGNVIGLYQEPDSR